MNVPESKPPTGFRPITRVQIFCVILFLLAGCAMEKSPTPNNAVSVKSANTRVARGQDLREPMELAANAIPPRLDPRMDFRPWFLLRGSNNIPAFPEHSIWDAGDMTGRYLESLILARRMGITSPKLSEAEWRLQKFLFQCIRDDGLVHDPQTGNIDNSFSQGSAMYGLLSLFEDTSDPQVRTTLELLITTQLHRMIPKGDQLIDPSVKLEHHSGCHLAGYQIYPAIRFYELTGYADALKFAEGLTQWCLADPVLGDDGEIKSTDSWAGHLHSWLDTLAGCVRTARSSPTLDREKILARCRAAYDWIRRSNMTSFGWVATFPTHGSSETCAISSAIRLALELSACGHDEYLNDVERFVRNQVFEAQFKNLDCYRNGIQHATPLLCGVFDSQSLPNGHLGTRGGEDVGNVEGCCLNGGMRALALAWDAIEVADERGLTVQLALSRNGPAGEVIGYEPTEGRVDVIPRTPGAVRVHLPDWVDREKVVALVNQKPAAWKMEKSFARIDFVNGGDRVSVRYRLRQIEEDALAGGKSFHVRWRGNVVIGIHPPGEREPTYQNCWPAKSTPPISKSDVPDKYELNDAARLASCSMLARMDLARGGQPFFRTYPFADPPRAEHEKWDDGDMTGRYVEGLILTRHMTGLPVDSREAQLRRYLASIFDSTDGLCYTKQTAWTPHRADFFSQSSAMLGLLEWYRETGSPEARTLLDRQVDGLMRIAVDAGNYAYFPKYEFDGKSYVDDPPGKNAPIWYGGRLIEPLVEYWQISHRDDAKNFLEKLVRHCVDVSHFIKPDGAVEGGQGWWGHLHGTMDMAAGIAEFGRLTHRPELVAWSKRVYDWIGRTQTTSYGWVADVSSGNVCESCAIASRIRLGLALYRAGAADPFDEIDRHLRNQLLHNQFCNLSFLPPTRPEKPRTEQMVYDGIDRMVRGTFQCWSGANDLIGHDDVEGCGAGGGVQGLALAWDAQSEWRSTPQGRELRIHLLFNRHIRAQSEPPFTKASSLACELWSYLPNEGKVVLITHQAMERIALRLPGGADFSHVQTSRKKDRAEKLLKTAVAIENSYAIIEKLQPGEVIVLTFPLKEFETREHAGGHEYRVRWKGNAVVSIDPPGKVFPLYQNEDQLLSAPAPTSAPRYP